MNVIYLTAALKRLPAEVEAAAPAPARQDTVPSKNADETLKALWAERTRLFGEMNRMSNHFHDCTTDADRAANSDAIGKKWEEIVAVKERIRQYETTGEVASVATDEKFPLPEYPIELMKKIASIRAMISQAKKTLREAAELPDEHPERQKRIQEGEERLTYLNLYKGHAEQKARPDIYD
ncbi:MAG: hypothetical protein JNM22_05720 [Saprospiraceae bacterium]|nr:hypothetical protein [Saprospiraceae bacterium]